MHAHPIAGYGIVKRIGFLREAAEIVRAHHERFDGSGYPMGLRGEDIPVGARIFAVTDVYDAITSERPYRAPCTHDEAVAQIQGKSGTDFDPDVVQVFLTVEPEEFEAIRLRYPDSIEHDGE
jgi:HD-GYP domain-containing protein (c-di-GMP phosphodiesterase class II)